MIHQVLDISPDDQYIAFSFCDTNNCNIYEYSISDSNYTQITPNTIFRYFYPRYSPDGKKIIFLARNENGNLPKIYIYNKENYKITEIDTDSLYVTELEFNKNNNEIIFIAATVIKNSSLNSKPSFSYDIYKITNGSVEKITELKAKSITGLAVSKRGSVFTNIETFDRKYYGLYNISQKNLRNNGPTQIRAQFNEGTELGYNFLFNPTIAENDSVLIVTSSRIMVKVDLSNSKASTVLVAGEAFIYSPRFFHNSDKIIFTKDTMLNKNSKEEIDRGIYFIDLKNSKGITKFPINITKHGN